MPPCVPLRLAWDAAGLTDPSVKKGRREATPGLCFSLPLLASCPSTLPEGFPTRTLPRVSVTAAKGAFPLPLPVGERAGPGPRRLSPSRWGLAAPGQASH